MRVWMTVGLAAGVVSVFAEGTADVRTLEGLVGEWVDLRGAIAAETRDRATEEERLRAEISLLREELAMLERQRVSEGEDVMEAEQAALLARKAVMKRAIEGLEPVLDRAEERLRAWEAAIPPALSEPLRESFRALPAHAGRRESTARRLQVVLALYAQIEALQHKVHVGRELLRVQPDERREVDVLYLGLARGFAVSHDGRDAWIGEPSDNGWRWTPSVRHGGAIQEAIRVARREAPAGWVRLPLCATPEGGRP